jgi:organic radical activating enzyme
MTSLITRLHIEPTNICTLKCAGCARTQFINQWPNQWKNHSIDIDHLIKFLDVDLTNTQITLCGNYGDPIYHPDFLQLVKKLKQRNCRLEIVTNGSYKNRQWWTDLCAELSESDSVVFSVDGVPENFTIYRQNGDWDSIHTAMQVVVASGVRSMWKYIPFNYNVDDINAAENLSKKIGLSVFQVVASDRFDQHTVHLMPTDQFLGERKLQQDQFKSGSRQQKVNPKCAGGTEHFITATGHYVPCCYVADHRFYYKTVFGKEKKVFSIEDTTLTEILNQSKTVNFFQSISDQPSEACQFNCPAT